MKEKRSAVSDAKTQAALEVAKARIGNVGRVILRESGTEAVIRIMAEAESEELCREIVELIENAVGEGGHIAD